MRGTKHHITPQRANCANMEITAHPKPGQEQEAIEFIAKADRYFSNFAAPVRTSANALKCFHCGCDLTGFFGSFQWGIAHGEGQCSQCGWPGRAHHFAKFEGDDEALFTLNNFTLQYLPDDFSDADPTPHHQQRFMSDEFVSSFAS